MEVRTTPSVLAGRYLVVDRLGAGGMATVYLAEDERLGRKVAVKRLHADSPEDAARRFDREAKLGASLSHPSLVTVFDTVADDEGVLIVMEYVEGENLAALMARERVPTKQALSIIAQVAAGLDHAHAAGVVHRDVKPANILITPDGKAKLVDLGIATASERTQITAAGTVLGTPSYMAPEQLEGGRLSSAVDVYALGAVAFELLSGRKARRGGTPMEIAHQIAAEPAPDIRSVWSDAPADAADAIQTAMARDPAERPRSAGELAAALEAAFARGAARASRAAEPIRVAPRASAAAASGRATSGASGASGASAPAAPRASTSAASARGASGASAPAASGRAASAAPRRDATARRLPRWIPVAGLVAVLLVAAGAIAALSSGGRDKGVAPAIATHKQTAKAKAKSKPKAKAKTPTSTPTTESTSTSTAGAAAPSGDPASLQSQAHALIAQGQYDQAIALDKQVVAQGPGSGLTYAYALYDLGHALRLSGHPDQAIPVLEQRLKIDNQRDVVQAELDRAKQEAGRR